mgnify:CR=1 FL=1
MPMSANYCSSCGAEIESGINFCTECGEKIENNESKEQETQTTTEGVTDENEGAGLEKGQTSEAEETLSCSQHPSRDAVSTCADCGDGVCIECMTELENGTLCNECVEDRLINNQRSVLVVFLVVVGILILGSLVVSFMTGL